MKNIVTKRMKEDALALLQTRQIGSDLAFRLVGFIMETASRNDGETASGTLANFIRVNETEIRNQPLKKEAK